MSISKEGVKWGIIAGVVTIISYTVAYLISPQSYFNSGVSWLVILFNLFAMYMASKNARSTFLNNHDLAEDPYSFNIALQAPFLTYLITTVAFYILNYIMFNIVDPDFAELQRITTLEVMNTNSSLFIRLLGEDQFEQIMEAYEDQDNTVTISSTFLSLATSLLGGFLLSAIFALIFKKNQIQRLS